MNESLPTTNYDSENINILVPSHLQNLSPRFLVPTIPIKKLHEWIAQVLTKLYSNKRKQEEDRSWGRGSLVREESC